MRLCPVCNQMLREDHVDSITVDGCPNCGGVWFDYGELTALARTHPLAMSMLDGRFRNPMGPPPPPGFSRRCPVCSLPLEEQELRAAPGIRVDGCRRCKGIWLDDGELTALQKLVAERGAKGQGPGR